VGTLTRLLGGIAVGTAAGWALASLGTRAVPDLPALTIAPDNARLLLAGLLGGIITLAGFTYWMRAIVVQLVSAEISPRVLSAFLEDRFQENLLSFMAGATAFTAVVLISVPGADDPGATPHLAVLTALVLGLAALLGLLYAMRASVRSMQVGELVRRITERALEAVADEARAQPTGPVPSGPPAEVVRAVDSGWVGYVDRDAIEALLEGDERVAMDVREGEFVVHGSPVGRIWSSDTVDPELPERVAACVTTARTRDETDGRTVHVDRLVDIAERAMGSTVDATTMNEVIAHLGWLLERSLLDGERSRPADPPPVVLPRWQPSHEIVRDAFDRLRQHGARYPAVALMMVDTLGNVAARLPDGEKGTAVVRQLAEDTLEDCLAGSTRGGDVERVIDHARTRGLVGWDPVGPEDGRDDGGQAAVGDDRRQRPRRR
jgi:uncharacterized membrane protein